MAVPAGAQRVVPVGGGALGGAGDTRGWRLRRVPVHARLTLGPHSGVVPLARV